MKALASYQELIKAVDRTIVRIQTRYAEHIACQKGCAGNCCRIHLSILPVEAVSLSMALKRHPSDTVRYIRNKTKRATASGPCPLLDDGACLMHASRLVICRTHGIPMRNKYRGRQSIGCCGKNFQFLEPIPEDAVIDLDELNKRLAAVNRQFVSEYWNYNFPGSRLSIGEALMLELHFERMGS